MVSWWKRELWCLHCAALLYSCSFHPPSPAHPWLLSIGLNKPSETLVTSLELTTGLIFFPSVALNRHLLFEDSKPSAERFLGMGLVRPSYFFRVMGTLPDYWHFWESLVSSVRNCSFSSCTIPALLALLRQHKPQPVGAGSFTCAGPKTILKKKKKKS